MDVYELKLHESLSVNETTEVMRVPGGWIYTRIATSTGLRISSVYVPWTPEFEKASQPEPF